MTRAVVVAGVALAVNLGGLPSQAATPSKLPPGSIKHRNSQYWSWFAPKNWTSVDSANGISITSGNLRMFLD